VNTEQRVVRFGGTVITYTVVRSRRRKKTVTITIDPAEGVVVAAPLRAPNERIDEIVRKRGGWIVQTCASYPVRYPAKQFVSGESLPYLGRQVRLEVIQTEQGHPVLEFNHWTFRLRMPGDCAPGQRRDVAHRAVMQWYKQRALHRVWERVQWWSRVLGVAPQEVRMASQRRRWGSCGPDNVLRMNWRTVLLEPALMDYVIVHELAHLLERNHSPRFWAHVIRAMPDCRERRNRLKGAGAELPF
jgi:hypothetical protein